MRNLRDLNKLSCIAIVGVGLLGGSIGLALRAAGYTGRRLGLGRRRISLDKALKYDAVDEVTCDIAAGVAKADLVILGSPIGSFEPLLEQMAPALRPGTLITDMASTKTEVVRLTSKLLPRHVRFVGSHPMAGSEKTGVEYARADLFEGALCLITPTRTTPGETVQAVKWFWKSLGGRTVTLSPQRHDKLLARISHLPHAVAAALIQLSRRDKAIDLAGPGFADSTRIASGDPSMWRDIFRTNSISMIQAIDLLVVELKMFKELLRKDEAGAIEKWLADSKLTRDQWVARRYEQGRKRG
ncbi:MAG TPA: prephenate dehydrogenase/arogenate dehydrogenase family protein [Phycisphaerae bacterium]|nr:prephenate dehydrogenase/arogenate dehydrogenase family protein [Phycisphaerae bacterium]